MDAKISIFNDVLGPIMRGPSSSHTAAAFRLGRYLKAVFPGELEKAEVIFRTGQTYARTFRQQRSDLAFTAGFLGLDVEDDNYDRAFEIATDRGLEVAFGDRDLPWADHPNGLEMKAAGPGAEPLVVKASSVGGGSIHIQGLNQWSMDSSAESHDLLASGPENLEEQVVRCLEGKSALHDRQRKDGLFFLRAAFNEPPDQALLSDLSHMPGLNFWLAEPVSLVTRGEPLFVGAIGAMDYCRTHSLNLAEAGVKYEAALTGLTEDEVRQRLDLVVKVMLDSITAGLAGKKSSMFLLKPSASRVFQAEAAGETAFGGLNTRTGARALAVMEHCSSGGLVCAAPTAGSAGILPAVLTAITERWPNSPDKIKQAAMAGAVVGLVFDQGATFAAEIGGCQVEVGASAAMAAGAAMMAAGGTPEQIFQAAGIMLQNYMGLICDPVRGYVELPCHIRNALAASSCLTAVDLILGGYVDLVPFDQAVAATLETGRLLPLELRCTTLGGVAACPVFQEGCGK